MEAAMATKWISKLPTLAVAAVVACALTFSLTPTYAQKHGGGGGGGGQGGSGTDHADGVDSGKDSGHSGGKGGKGGQGMGRGGGSGSQSLRDIFNTMESGSTTAQPSATSEEHGSGSKGGSATTSHGKKGSASTATKGSSASGKKTGKSTTKAAEESDSDRPTWAGTKGGKAGGNIASGTKKGDVYGDMYVLLRDANGVPILKEVAPGVWVVQPVDANGVPLPLDAEGNLIDATQAIAVDLGRLNVGRSPSTVLAQQYEELLKSINAADSVSLDSSGRLVLTTNGVAAAVDSPLANLALYVELLNKGTITGVTDTSKFTASNLTYLVDSTKTAADFVSAASFLAAAADKTGTLTTDKVVDMNTILGITGTLTSATGATYVDYSSFTYDRASVYSTMTADVLVKQTDGTYKVTTVNLYDVVLKSTAYTGTNVDAFATAANDALQVLEYLHNNPIPATE
jgi:hypothetical protein